MAKPVLKILLTFSLLASGTFASAKISQSSLQNLQDSLDQLIIVKNSNVSSEEKFEADLTARQAAFNRILDLNIEELGGLKKRVEKTTNSERFKYLNAMVFIIALSITTYQALSNKTDEWTNEWTSPQTNISQEI